MKRLFGLLFLAVAACRPIATVPAGGASSPERAVDAFLAAAKAQDLQAMGGVWGTARGPARETMAREELERRELILIRLLCQDRAQVTSSNPGTDGRRVLRLDMTRGTLTIPVTFTTIRGPEDRWYVEDVEVVKLQELCTAR